MCKFVCISGQFSQQMMARVPCFLRVSMQEHGFTGSCTIFFSCCNATKGSKKHKRPTMHATRTRQVRVPDVFLDIMRQKDPKHKQSMRHAPNTIRFPCYFATKTIQKANNATDTHQTGAGTIRLPCYNATKTNQKTNNSSDTHQADASTIRFPCYSATKTIQ